MKQRIYENASLIKKSLLHSLTQKEQQEIDELLKNQSLKKIYTQLQNKAFLETAFKEYEQFSSSKAFLQFRKHNKRLRQKYRLRIILRGIAASFIIISGILIWLTSQSDKQQTAEITATVIPAGEIKAHLILADGNTVVINHEDSLSFSEGNVKIKATKGWLSYNTDITTQTPQYNQLEVPKGGECNVMLSDGSQVWVNSDSKLTYPICFIGNERRVKLQGEAFFQVTPNSKPFIVETSYGNIQVLGTSFNVSAYSTDSISYATLMTGKISMTTPNNSLTITPGEQIVATPHGELTKRQVNTDEYVGWKDGEWIFRSRRLEDITRILERWYNISITFENEALKNILFTGYLKRYDHANVILNALTRTEELNYEIKNNHVILR